MRDSADEQIKLKIPPNTLGATKLLMRFRISPLPHPRGVYKETLLWKSFVWYLCHGIASGMLMERSVLCKHDDSRVSSEQKIAKSVIIEGPRGFGGVWKYIL
ncbi:hypothetical protein CDAR_89701 [Caerostris darwini]|uniref:Uncharacterized protein n=1 Tax=Caerostris darwini TaxID=1538125 RepID=A0AAV4RMI0_9ARAC|nr:hypothetical protein CDAR_89701 [Caerostris darwini]